MKNLYKFVYVSLLMWKHEKNMANQSYNQNR